MRCTTCHQSLYLGAPTYATPCGHLFHSNCVFQWLRENSTCPLCRSECLEENLLKIFLPEVDLYVGDVNVRELQLKIDDLHFQVAKYLDGKNNADYKLEQVQELLHNKMEQIKHLKESQNSLRNNLQKTVNEKITLLENYRLLQATVKIVRDKNQEIKNIKLRGVKRKEVDLTKFRRITHYFSPIQSFNGEGQVRAGGSGTFGNRKYDLVYTLIRQNIEENGININCLFNQVKRTMCKVELENSLDFLCSDGHIYPTIEGHFKATDGH